MGNDSTYNMDIVVTVLIKMFDVIVRELKDVRYIPQMKKNFISIGASKAHGLEYPVETKFSRCSKAIWWC